MGEIHDEMQVVHKELSCNGVNLKVAKTEFYSKKNLKHRRIAWKVHHQSHLVPCKFFSERLDYAVGICDTLKIVHKEITCDRVKNYILNPLEPLI